MQKTLQIALKTLLEILQTNQHFKQVYISNKFTFQIGVTFKDKSLMIIPVVKQIHGFSNCSSPDNPKALKLVLEFLSHVRKYLAALIALHFLRCTDYSKRHQNVKEALLVAFPTTSLNFLYFSQGFVVFLVFLTGVEFLF